MNHLRKLGLTAIYMAAAEAAVSTGAPVAAPGTTATVPDSNAVATDKPKRAPKNPDNILDIINGRLPIALVYLIRFKEQGVATATVAKKYGTSVGKVFDIVKGRNFGYLTEAYKPSAEEVTSALAWLDLKTAKGKSLKEAGGDPDAIKAAVTAMGTATAEEVAARNWATRTVGVKKEATAGEAPVAGAVAAPAAGDGAPAPKAGAKLF